MKSCWRRFSSVWTRLFLLPPLLVFYSIAAFGQNPARSGNLLSQLDINVSAADRAEQLRRAVRLDVKDLVTRLVETKDPVYLASGASVDSVIIDETAKTLEIRMNKAFAFIPFRAENTQLIYSTVWELVGPYFPDYEMTISALGKPIQELIPNFFRGDTASYDRSRMPAADSRGRPLVTRADWKTQPTEGLLNRNIAVWPSHGWYYEHSLKRWEWQRARLFQTVEDVLPASFVLPFLVPMLENAGANVFLPRERDTQIREVVIDNDYSDERTYREAGNWRNGGTGFAVGSPPYTDRVNPFLAGTFRQSQSAPVETASIIWEPEIPEAGKYAVYVAYRSVAASSDKVTYVVRHAGGATRFLVNQQIGGGTWVYLGTFSFKAGKERTRGSVSMSNEGPEGTVVTADAVRFGGGMGSIEREGTTSGRPRFTEAARYYLQYAGMPDSLVYNVSDPEGDDYVDDYQGRGEWVNYLRGAPFGPNKRRETKGLGIPVDLSLAFHTDAGKTDDGRVVGTLMIYNSDGATADRKFPDGMSRFANRDFGDILQSQIVDDLRVLWDSSWTRRSIWDEDYSEAFRPNVPSALLELLSHQNFQDMKFAQDPRFRFDVSRAIYKAMLRFLATQFNQDYTIQPLPVDHFETSFTEAGDIRLRWRPVADPLEPTSSPSQYIVYTRIADGGFDNGRLVSGTEWILIDPQPDVQYSFRVTAVNAGGESFPSEILAVYKASRQKGTVLVVNGFDRVAPPAILEAGVFAGFANFVDQGVPFGEDISFTGDQYEFLTDRPWLDDDAPGHGASHADREAERVAGNTFDYPTVHTASLARLNYSVVSSSDESVMAGNVLLSDYRLVDLILGEERETGSPTGIKPAAFKAFPPGMQRAIRNYTESGGGLLVSGAYLASDLCRGGTGEVTDRAFLQSILKAQWCTDHGSKTGEVYATGGTFLPYGTEIRFSTRLNPDLLAIESANGINPANNSGSRTILRFAENNVSAGILYQGNYKLVLLGFPFESVREVESRDRLMEAVVRVLE